MVTLGNIIVSFTWKSPEGNSNIFKVTAELSTVISVFFNRYPSFADIILVFISWIVLGSLVISNVEVPILSVKLNPVIVAVPETLTGCNTALAVIVIFNVWPL